ncbi:MAG TPA: HD domain-containing phosphohydrolase [Chloroflexia bacterium]|nr:HD domain-containing phosphohydrolase [Chloroflexia bacterium]
MQAELIQTAKILIVDDTEANVRYLERVLQRAGAQQVQSTTDAREVLGLVTATPPDLIVLDLMMPYLDGFAVMQQLQPLIPPGTYLPILVITADISSEAKQQALLAGAKDFLTKPFDPVEALLRIGNLIETRHLHQQLQNQNQLLEEKVRVRTQELEATQIEILERLALAAEYRDDETGQHTQRVGRYAVFLAQALGLPALEVDMLRRAAPLHDIGKIGIPDHILLKPGKLTPSEFEEMKTHTLIGARILAGGSELIRMAQLIAVAHHEHWDGGGYPHRRAGEQIPLVGRIVAVADVFDALRHDRPYKPAWPLDDARAEIVSQRGRQFDPRVVDAFLLVEELRQPALRAPGSPIAAAACAGI